MVLITPQGFVSIADPMFSKSQCLLIIFWLLSALAADTQANSAAGVDTLLGNTLNPTGTDTTQTLDERGLATFKKTFSRSPTGLLYEPPFNPPRFGKIDDWHYRGSIEGGFLIDDDSAKPENFIEYSDWSEGPLLNYFNFSSWQENKGYFLDLSGGGVGRDDQYYLAQGGRYGLFKLTGFFNEIPHVFETRGLTLFQGVGSQQLLLPAGLVPGNNTAEEIHSALEAASRRSLDLSRKKGGLGFEVTPTPHFRIHGRYTQEANKGTRPFGGTFLAPFYTGGTAGGVVETVEPINYLTHDLLTGFNYGARRYQLNFTYRASFFRNQKKTLSWENPFKNLPGERFVVERGRFALYPDNDFHNVKLDFSYRLPLRGLFTSTAAWSRMHQDDDLIPPTVNSGQADSGIDLNNWNTTAALSQKTAQAEINTWLFQVGLRLVPFDPLTLRADFRYYDEDNDTDYTAFNPLTGEIGYIVEDGADPNRGFVFQPNQPARPFHFRNIPFAQRKKNWSFNADYRLIPKTTLGLGYQREVIERDYREREETRENRLIARVSNRSIPWATFRFSYEFSDRTGSPYRFDPYTAFFTNSLPEFNSLLPQGTTPFTLADLRKFDLSDREQHLFRGLVNVLLGETMDFSLSFTRVDNDFDARFGLLHDENNAINLEWNYQPSPKLNTYVFGSYQTRTNAIANINDAGFSTDPNAGGTTFPLSAAWRENMDETNTALGVGFFYQFDRFTLDGNYSFNWSRSEIDYEAASNLALANPELSLDAIGNSFPDIKYTRHILETNLRWKINKNLALRLLHRYERGTIRDWHFEGLNPLIDNHLFLVATPNDFEVNLVGLLIQYKIP